MNPETKLIKAICKNIVYNNSNKEIKSLIENSAIDWQLLRRLLEYHEVSPFVYLALRGYEKKLPPEIFRYLYCCYYYAISDNMDKTSEYQALRSAFEVKGVEILPIKGMALLDDIYSELFIRPMTDIDILVKKEDIARASEIFHNLGYRKKLYGLKESYWLESQCHLAFFKDRSLVEMHWGLDFERHGRQILPEVWRKVRGIEADRGVVKLLSPEDTFFSLALHKRRFGKILSIKNVLDSRLLLNKYKDGFDWNYVLKKAAEYGLMSSVFFMLSQIDLLFDVEAPLVTGIRIPFWKKRLINRSIENNTFLPSIGSLTREVYLKNHFLLYDNIFESIGYIMNIPKEQFAKFYDIGAYDKKTDFLYRNRFIYIPFRLIHKFICRQG